MFRQDTKPFSFYVSYHNEKQKIKKIKQTGAIQLVFNLNHEPLTFPSWFRRNIIYSETKTRLNPVHRFKHFTADNTHNTLFIPISGRHERCVYSESGDHIHEKNPTDEPRKDKRRARAAALCATGCRGTQAL